MEQLHKDFQEGYKLELKAKMQIAGKHNSSICLRNSNRNIYKADATYLYQMLQKYNRYNILQKFFDFPTKNFQMREISRLTKIAQPSVIAHLKALLKEGLIIKEKKGIYPTLSANRDNNGFKTYKKFNLIVRMYEIGLIDYIYDSYLPDSIILFGSASKGEDIEKSDIDLFVQAKAKKLDLGKYEKLLNRKIALLFEENFAKLSNELKNNILNGILLKGYIKVF